MMLETHVLFLSHEDTLEKKMANHFNIPALEIPWTEAPNGLQSMMSEESDTTERLNHHQGVWRRRR